MTSTGAQEFATFLESLGARIASVTGHGLDIVRDVTENLHRAGVEPEGVTYAEVNANGVDALWCIPDGADTEHALLHFHMGGTVVASMHSDRKAAAHIAKATGVRSLVIDFRRAPENKYLLHADLAGLPPTSLQYGTAEILAGEDAAFGDRLTRAGVDVDVRPLADGPHSFVIAAGRVPEVDDAIAETGQWLRSKLGIPGRSAPPRRPSL
jgi:acetyl esterase/lipase